MRLKIIISPPTVKARAWGQVGCVTLLGLYLPRLKIAIPTDLFDHGLHLTRYQAFLLMPVVNPPREMNPSAHSSPDNIE